MIKTSDVDGLFTAIEKNPQQYQEITQFEDANKSLGRWSLISEVHRMDHSKEAKSIWAQLPSNTTRIYSQSTTQDDLENTKSTRPSLDAPLIEPAQLSKNINELIVNATHIKVPPLESISALFLRLNHS